MTKYSYETDRVALETPIHFDCEVKHTDIVINSIIERIYYMSDYIFYFDEAFHDRKITVSEVGTLNTQVPNALDNYVGVFWGEHFSKISENQIVLTELENKYKNIYGLGESQELKSDIVKQKNYKYGLKSFNKNAFSLYYDFFDLMNHINPILHLSIMSKIELLIRSIFTYVDDSAYLSVNNQSFYYSLVKFFVVYGNTELLSSLYYATDPKSIMILKDEIVEHLTYVIEAIRDIERKKRELPAMESLVLIISECPVEIRPKRTIDYKHSMNFDGLNKLLNELKLDAAQTTILIDKEESTYLSACNFQFKSVVQFDSKENIQIRMADLLAGFVGRMIYAISNDENIQEDVVVDIKDIAENDLSTKRLLSKEWFEVNVTQFNLYCMIYDLIVDKQQNHWTIMTMTYADKLISFITLLRYFKQYETFEEFSKHDPKMHAEYYNGYVCHELEERYKNFT